MLAAADGGASFYRPKKVSSSLFKLQKELVTAWISAGICLSKLRHPRLQRALQSISKFRGTFRAPSSEYARRIIAPVIVKEVELELKDRMFGEHTVALPPLDPASGLSLHAFSVLHAACRSY